MFRMNEESLSFWLEIALFVIIPIVLLSQEKIRNHPQTLYWTCAVVVMGFMANRLNVSITGLQASSGVYYIPKWTEFACTLATANATDLIDLWSCTSFQLRWPIPLAKTDVNDWRPLFAS